MDEKAGWEPVGQLQRATGGYAHLTHRMRVPGGYLYHSVVMDLGGWWRAKFDTSMAFVPDPPGQSN
jgi:hypothetical protein